MEPKSCQTGTVDNTGAPESFLKKRKEKKVAITRLEEPNTFPDLLLHIQKPAGGWCYTTCHQCSTMLTHSSSSVSGRGPETHHPHSPKVSFVWRRPPMASPWSRFISCWLKLLRLSPLSCLPHWHFYLLGRLVSTVNCGTRLCYADQAGLPRGPTSASHSERG